MGRVLYDGLVEYEDGAFTSCLLTLRFTHDLTDPSTCLSLEPRSPTGTPATTSQMAKDVTTFLNWASEPELDERHKLGLQGCTIMAAMWFLTLYVKRYKWTPIKARKIRASLPVLLCIMLPLVPKLITRLFLNCLSCLRLPVSDSPLRSRPSISESLPCFRTLPISLQPSPSFVSLDGTLLMKFLEEETLVERARG